VKNMASAVGAEAAAAYEAIVKAFGTNSRYEIEILPSSIIPPDGQLVMVDEECIGIPKKVLVQGFLVARAKFMSKLRNTKTSDTVRLITKKHNGFR
jgi:hypothetical protein